MTDNAWPASPTFPIGAWVRRLRDPDEKPTTLAHLVESVINDDPITRCGRTFARIEGTTLRYDSAPPEHVRCYRCRPR